VKGFTPNHMYLGNAANEKAVKKLLDNDALGLSGVVANSAMNRERVCVGNSHYDQLEV
jgi:hypothetical protein